jgi:hypothetical protein
MDNKFPVPTTELEAVNTMLSVIGETPVNTLSGQMVTDAVIAKNVLNEISREVQSEGWHFNTEDDYPLTPNSDGEIVLPKNCVRVHVASRSSLDVVQRGTRLYDRTNHTYRFTSTVHADVVFLLPFEEMPEAARRYVTIRAARVFQDRVVGAGTLHDFNVMDEARARGILVDAESITANVNMISGPDNFLSGWSISKVLER